MGYFGVASPEISKIYFFLFYVNGKVFFVCRSKILNSSVPCMQVCHIHPLGKYCFFENGLLYIEMRLIET